MRGLVLLQALVALLFVLPGHAVLSGRGQLSSKPTVKRAAAKPPAETSTRTVALARAMRAARASYRQSQFVPTPLAASRGAVSFLEHESVGPATRSTYRFWMKALFDFAVQIGESSATGDRLVCICLDYLDELFFRGHPVDDGKKVLAALRFSRLEFGKTGLASVARVERALKGWGRHTQPRRRWPLPFPAACALTGFFLKRGWFWTGICLLLAFWTYMRPGEWASLTARCLVPPVPAAGLRHWSIHLSATELGKPSKTGQYDESLALDLAHHAVLSPWLAMLRHRRADAECIWIHSHAEMIRQFQLGVAALKLDQLDLQWYNCRHGGVSHDIMLGLRDVAGAKRRLRQMSDLSVRHYECSGKLNEALHLIPEKTLAFGLDVQKHLAAYLQTPTKVPALP